MQKPQLKVVYDDTYAPKNINLIINHDFIHNADVQEEELCAGLFSIKKIGDELIALRINLESFESRKHDESLVNLLLCINETISDGSLLPKDSMKAAIKDAFKCVPPNRLKHIIEDEHQMKMSEYGISNAEADIIKSAVYDLANKFPGAQYKNYNVISSHRSFQRTAVREYVKDVYKTRLSNTCDDEFVGKLLSLMQYLDYMSHKVAYSKYATSILYVLASNFNTQQWLSLLNGLVSDAHDDIMKYNRVRAMYSTLLHDIQLNYNVFSKLHEEYPKDISNIIHNIALELALKATSAAQPDKDKSIQSLSKDVAENVNLDDVEFTTTQSPTLLSDAPTYYEDDFDEFMEFLDDSSESGPIEVRESYVSQTVDNGKLPIENSVESLGKDKGVVDDSASLLKYKARAIIDSIIVGYSSYLAFSGDESQCKEFRSMLLELKAKSSVCKTQISESIRILASEDKKVKTTGYKSQYITMKLPKMNKKAATMVTYNSAVFPTNDQSTAMSHEGPDL